MGVVNYFLKDSIFDKLNLRLRHTLFLVVFISPFFVFAQNLEGIKEVKKIKDRKAFEYGGGFSLGGSFYNSNGATQRMAPWNWMVSGSPYIKLYGIQIPFNFTYSETGRSLTHPFHYQFSGASPYYKWATTHIGFRSMRFSDYTMSGVVFNGFGLELKPKKFYLGAFYGVFNPAVEADSFSENFGVILPSYKRIGYGIKTGFGTDRNNFYLSIFRGKDDPESLRRIPSFETIKPMDNISLGPTFKFTMFKRWFIESDIALSIVTRNVLNDSLKESTELQQVNRFIRVNTTSYGAFAGHLATGLNFDRWQISFRARQISSDYQSLGINLLQDDIREFTVNPALSLFKNKVSINGSYGFYTDNVSKKRLNTTRRNIYNSQISLVPVKKLNITLGYNNFGTTRTNGLVQMNDSITFSIINSAYNGGISYNFGTPKKPFPVSFSGVYQKASDRNIFTQKFNNSEVLNLGLNGSRTIDFLKLRLSGSLSFARFAVGGSEFETRNIQTSFNRSFKENKYKTGLSMMYSTRYKEGNKQGNVMSANMQFQLQLGKRHNIQSQIRLMRNNTGIISNTAFNEQRASLQYGFNF